MEIVQEILPQRRDAKMDWLLCGKEARAIRGLCYLAIKCIKKTLAVKEN